MKLPLKLDDPTKRMATRIRTPALVEAFFVIPIVLVIGIIIIIPTASGVLHSFTAWNPGYASPFAGFSNYVSLIKSVAFRDILGNQAFLLLGLPIWGFLPLLFAVLLYENVPGAGVFRSIFFFPSTASPAIIGILFSFLLSAAGPLNTFLHDFGLGFMAQNWLVSVPYVKPVLIGVLAWATMGTGIVIFSAALSAFPPELLEASVIDGASWVVRFFQIILPNLWDVMQLWIVILVVSVFTAMFPWIFTLTGGGPGYASTTMDFDIYQNALTYGYFGTAAAEMVYLLIVLGILLYGVNLLFRWLRR